MQAIEMSGVMGTLCSPGQFVTCRSLRLGLVVRACVQRAANAGGASLCGGMERRRERRCLQGADRVIADFVEKLYTEVIMR